jgi:hypothetical protein
LDRKPGGLPVGRKENEPSMLSPRFHLMETREGWTVYERDAPLLTPMGHPVTSRHHALAERILEGARAAGEVGHDQPTPYSLQIWYRDFGTRVPLDHLRSSVRNSLHPQWDLACNPPRDSRLAAAALQAYDAAWGYTDPERLRARVDGLARRPLLTVAVFCARFQSARLGLRVIDKDVDLECLCVGMCALVAERRVGRSLHGDPRYVVPAQGLRESFCRDHCLPRIAPHPNDDTALGLRRSARNCGMRRLLEGVRFFASFPDE